MTTSRRNFLIGAAIGRAGIAQAAQGPGAASPPVTHTGEALSVRDFGARGDGRTDDHAALSSAVAAAAAGNRSLVLRAGTYLHGRPLNLAFAGLRIRGEGLVTLRHTGASSPCVSMDAGDRAILYDHVLENIIIEGSGAPNQDGLFVRNMPHGIRRNIRVRNVTGRAFHILGDVLSTWENCIVSANEGAFRHVPARDFQIGGSAAVSATTAVLFINCIAESATECGWYLDRCDDCKWVGGASEGLGRHGTPGRRPIGLFVSRGASQNSFDSVSMELNDGGDVVVEGNGNHFVDCVMQSRAAASPYESVRSITVRGTARGNRFEGGSAYFAAVERGASNSTFRHIELTHSINDQGAGTVIADCLQLFNSAARFPSRTFGNVDDHNPLALDWYQEVRFEPSLQGSRSGGRLTYGRRIGVATRIGNICMFSIELEIASIGQAPAGPLVVDGLPFPANADIGSAIAIGEIVNVGPGEGHVGARIDAGQSAIRLLCSPSAGSPIGLDGGALRTGAVLRLSGHYTV